MSAQANPIPSNTVHVVLPANLDDPRRPSGGNLYGRRLCDELPHWDWVVVEHPVDDDRLDGVLNDLPDQSVVLIDGLVGATAESLVAASRRLQVVVLLHMPFAEATPALARVEAAVLNAAVAVIATSEWTRDWVVTRHGVPADRVRAAIPGVDPAPVARGSAPGGNLLCVGPVTAAKGHDILVSALGRVADLEWQCTCAGALDLDPAFVEWLRAAAEHAGIVDRLVLSGPLSRPELDELRSRTDLAVAPSRRESYGMGVVEALACGIPVVATDVGGHREAIGQASDGTLPGILIPRGDVDELAAFLRRWLTDPDLRRRSQKSAALRSRNLTGWAETARIVADVLSKMTVSGMRV